ncbi:uncharacterized protein JCM10292_004820 [Rhodotorula paludigena]|uniref:uncharacterized protein n=1 Tax=Rhodotorula paludigena TaxID=86838 RepID=UPI00317C8090
MAPREHELEYRPLMAYWRNSDAVSVSFAPHADLEVHVPLDFIARSGNDTLGFVQFLAQLLVDESGVLYSDEESAPQLDLTSAPWPTRFRFVPGESLKLDSLAGIADCRSTTTSFLLDLIGRDGGDYFTETLPSSCTAAHLVPVSRPGIYHQLLGVTDLYDVSFGRLMDNRLCPLYYSYDWSLYYHEGRYFPHAFKPIDPVGTAINAI